MSDLLLSAVLEKIREKRFLVFWDEAIKSIVIAGNKQVILLTAFGIPEPMSGIIVMMYYEPWYGTGNERMIKDSNGETVAMFEPEYGVVVDHRDRHFIIPFKEDTEFLVTRITL